ncbi:hypothetical protein ANRL4_04610 [Anaerolineae bacterium]|nr:hypothetical protein ANRL4_04610 [Anaerolineae bacterium]
MIFSSAVLIVDDLVNPLEGDTKRGSERLHRFPGAVSTADQIVSLCNGERFIRLRGSDIELLQNSLNRLCEPFSCGTVSRLYIPIGASLISLFVHNKQQVIG